MNKQFQWYPGHMYKTEKELDKLKLRFDLFFLLLDARAPNSSLMTNFLTKVKKNKIVIFLTKIDLVEKSQLKKWQNYYKKIYLDCILIDKNNSKGVRREILLLLNKQIKDKVFPKILITGIPNVGKSTLLNILKQKNVAKIENRPGVTNRLNWYQINNFWILDTPGILEPKFETLDKGIKLALIGSINLNILPLEEVVEFLNEKIKNNLNAKKLENFDELKQYVINFQNGKYGKIILDEFEN